MHPLLSDITSLFKEVLFPISCLTCNAPGQFVCAPCLAGMRQVPFQRCIACQKPAALGLTHPSCRRPERPEQLISLLDYHDPTVANAIIAGKYKFLPDVFHTLGTFMAQHAMNNEWQKYWADSIVTFITLAARRQSWRSFNQSELLAKPIAAAFSQRPQPILARTKMAKPQKELSRGQRKENLKGSFACRAGANIRGQRLVLIDDVTTTGATLMEAAKALKQNGARAVYCLTLAQD